MMSPARIFRVARASAHADPVQAIGVSPDGKQLVTGAFRHIVIWNVEAADEGARDHDG